MLNTNHICVFDFETTSTDPHTCEVTEIGCKLYDFRTLEPHKNGEFFSEVRPNIWLEDDSIDHTKASNDTLNFHANNQNKSVSDVLEEWKEYPDESQVWKNFINFLKEFNTDKRGSQWGAPIMAGYNIFSFDLPILNRLCKKYGTTDKNGNQKLFHKRDKIDIMHLMFCWLESSPSLSSLSFDQLREYFGLSKEGAHNALVDVRQEGQVLTRFLKYMRNLFDDSKFKGVFK